MNSEYKKSGKTITVLKCIAAVVLAIIAYFLAPIILRLIDMFFQLSAPNYYKHSFLWGYIVAYCGSAVVCSAIMTGMQESKVLYYVVVGLMCLYTVFVAVWNYLLGVNAITVLIAQIAESVTFLICIIQYTRDKK